MPLTLKDLEIVLVQEKVGIVAAFMDLSTAKKAMAMKAREQGGILFQLARRKVKYPLLGAGLEVLPLYKEKK